MSIRRQLSFLSAVVALFIGVLLTFAPVAGAVGTGGSAPFGLTPVFASGVPQSSYFQFSVAAGVSTTGHIHLANLGQKPETIDLGVSEGVTASNSGSAYSGAFDRCAGVSCWIGGLPSVVQLAVGQTMTLPFTVTVPGGSAPGQYLAGVTAKPADAGAPVTIGQKGASRAQAVIIHEITVGVAITVGDPSSLATHLVVTNVTAKWTGDLPRLLVAIRNDGQRFADGTGDAVCTKGQRSWSYQVVVSTLLPGDDAVVPVNATGLPSGAATACEVRLTFAPIGSPGSSASASAGQSHWLGTVALPATPGAKPVEVAPGVYATIPHPGLPKWALYVMIGGGVLIVLLLLAVWRGRRRARRARAAHLPS